MPYQVRVGFTTTAAIMRHKNFSKGLAEVRAGMRFDPDVSDHPWEYERGRLFGMIAPLSMPLFIGGKLNPKAVALCDAAFNRKLIL